ncbi:MAG TPA: CPBP family intramembrane glutamic endopeptidase [Microbacteriaceae bacterium]|nr:CPBP family intramembrane glutamic endopeptidase [Microbacteriaceae bacterium]
MSRGAPPLLPERVDGRGRLIAELVIVLGLSLGQSAVYSVVAIINRATREQPLSQQTATLNPTLDSREVFDLIYQLLDIAFGLMPVALVCWLLWSTARPHLGRLGLAFDRPARDAGWGALLALAIGAGGIVVYLGGRALGLTVAVNPAGLDAHWWTVPVLLLAAARAGIVEEVIMVGYLFERLRRLGWGTWPIILLSATLRGAYHLYQGWGSFVGNFLMGIVFGWIAARWGRVLPLVVAHFLIDAVVFVGYPFAAAAWPALFGLPG